MKKHFVFLLVGMFLITFISATNYYPPVKQGDCINTKQTCSSCSYVNISIAYPNTTLSVSNQAMSPEGAGLWSYDYCDTDTLGEYSVTGEGDLLGLPTGFDTLTFKSTQNGEIIDQSQANLSLFGAFLLFIFFFFSLFGIFKTDNYIGKFVCYWISHVLLIALSFIMWTTSSNYLGLGGGITGVFKVIFYFSTIAVVPMLFLSISWVVYIHLFNEHFQKLVDKGMTTEDAFKITSKKRGGWINGK